ncbi:MAG: ABC transporter permease subunit [Firmicutes bacterium]|nr:ABC transporter permease subunit [Bacillota bacterium]
MFPEQISLELGKYADDFIRWLNSNFGAVFDAIRDGVLWLLLNIEWLLLLMPWWLFIGLVFLLGWRLKSVVSGLVFAAMMFTIGAFGLWEPTMSTLAIVLASVFFSLLVGIPVGIAMGSNNKLAVFLKPVLDAMQTLPSFVYLIPAVILFDMGKVPGVFATMIYALPPIIRLTDLGLRRVSKEMVEAGQSFGSSSWQMLFRVKLPQALPTIMAGINQTTMMALAMVVIAAMIGAGGVGHVVVTSINRIDIARGTESGLAVVFLAIIIDRLTQSMADRYNFDES